MNVVSIDTLWDEIESLTYSMQQLAAEGEWESLLSYHSKRQVLLVRLFRLNQNKPGLHERITELMVSEKDLLNICDNEKQNISNQLLEMRRGKKITRHYQNV